MRLFPHIQIACMSQSKISFIYMRDVSVGRAQNDMFQFNTIEL